MFISITENPSTRLSFLSVTIQKLLIPVMTSAMAAQGGVTGATSVYTTTVIADGVMSALISNILVPGIYIFLALSIANSMTGQEILQKLL